MIAQGMAAPLYSEGLTTKQAAYISETSVFLAKAVLEEANK